MFPAYAICFLSALLHVSAAPTNASLSNFGAGNATQLSLVDTQELKIDPRFGMQIQRGDDDINDVSSYMNVIRMLGYEALQDWEGTTEPVRVQQPPWNSVIVAAGSVIAQQLKRKYLVWGLYQAIITLADLGFKNTGFFLLYDNSRVGVITVDRPRRSNHAKPDSSLPLNVHQLDYADEYDPSHNHGPDINPTPSRRVDPAFLPNAQTLSKAAIFLVLASAMSQVAEVDKDRPMINFGIQDPENQSQIFFRVAEGRQPVAMKFSDAVTALWDMAKFVANRNRYVEFKASVTVDGALAGTVTVTKIAAGDPAVQGLPDGIAAS